jgi:hypothetical protein
MILWFKYEIFPCSGVLKAWPPADGTILKVDACVSEA